MTTTQIEVHMTTTQIEVHMTTTQIEVHMTTTQIEVHMTTTQIEVHMKTTQIENTATCPDTVVTKTTRLRVALQQEQPLKMVKGIDRNM